MARAVHAGAMFNMTNDSHLFRTAAQLEADGFYPVQGNRWKRGEALYLPLYQGRMIWQFDHRANSVREVNPESTHNPYLSEPVSHPKNSTLTQAFCLRRNTGLPAENVESVLSQSEGWTLGFRDITNGQQMFVR